MKVNDCRYVFFTEGASHLNVVISATIVAVGVGIEAEFVLQNNYGCIFTLAGVVKNPAGCVLPGLLVVLVNNDVNRIVVGAGFVINGGNMNIGYFIRDLVQSIDKIPAECPYTTGAGWVSADESDVPGHIITPVHSA
jgi:hypothetical protein